MNIIRKHEGMLNIDLMTEVISVGCGGENQKGHRGGFSNILFHFLIKIWRKWILRFDKARWDIYK